MLQRMRQGLSPASIWETKNVYWQLGDIAKLVGLYILGSLAAMFFFRRLPESYFVVGRFSGIALVLFFHRLASFWPSWEDFGMTLRDFRQHFKLGLFWGVVGKFAPILIIIPLLILASIIWGDQLASLDLESNLGMAGMPVLSFEWFLLTIGAVVLAPLWEEITTRGIIYPYLRQKWGVRSAVLLSSLIFALLHGIGLILVPTFIVGVILALLYERTGSLAPCIIAHAVFNLIAVIAHILPGVASVLS